MQTIITIQEGVFPDTAVPTVNARDLHAFLGVGKVFRAWIQERIEQYNFIENQDFIVSSEIGRNPQGGRPSKEYHITLDMAQELSMVERTPKGKEARQYFIACEKKYRQISSGEAPYSGDPRFARFANANWPAVARMHAAYKRVARSRKIPFAEQVQVADMAVEALLGIPLNEIVNEAIARLKAIDPDAIPDVPPKKRQTATKRAAPKEDNLVALDPMQGAETRLRPDAEMLPSALGALFGGYTAQGFNKILYALGYQEPHHVRGKSEWHPTAKGAPFAVITYVPRAGGSGADVPQLLWKAKILEALQAEPAVQQSLRQA